MKYNHIMSFQKRHRIHAAAATFFEAFGLALGVAAGPAAPGSSHPAFDPGETNDVGFEAVFSWEIYGKPMEIWGKPMEIWGKSMEIYGKPLEIWGKPVENHGKSMDIYGNVWKTLGKSSLHWDVDWSLWVILLSSELDGELFTAVMWVELCNAICLIQGPWWRKWSKIMGVRWWEMGSGKT